MIIFLGLGNNDKQYLDTKHNAGRLLLEALAAKWGQKFEKQKNFFWTNSGKTIENDRLILLYSAGFMNNSGEILASFLSYYKPDLANLLVVVFHDDSDQFENKQKLVVGGGSGGHNGIGSIYQHFPEAKTTLWRVKIGVRPELNRLKSGTFVLQKMSPNEKERITDLAGIIDQNLDLFTQNYFGKLQTLLNSF